jgi:uncharacterized protein (TIGR02594 family)
MIIDTRDSFAEPAWMPVAIAERGIRRFPVGETNPRIVEYNSQTNLVGYDDKISWCSSFINWCLAGVGVRGTASALARSWLDWGIALESPAYGCITVLTRDDPPSWKGHVGFYLRHDADYVYLVSVSGSRLELRHCECEGVAFVRTRAMRWKTRTLRLQRQWVHVGRDKGKRSGVRW